VPVLGMEPPRRVRTAQEGAPAQGCGGRFDPVTGFGSPGQGLVELEVRLGLGERIGQRGEPEELGSE
jgi:hypothetical protein